MLTEAFESDPRGALQFADRSLESDPRGALQFADRSLESDPRGALQLLTETSVFDDGIDNSRAGSNDRTSQ